MQFNTLTDYMQKVELILVLVTLVGLNSVDLLLLLVRMIQLVWVIILEKEFSLMGILALL